MLGVFLLPACIHLGHECQGLLSPCDEMHVCTDWTSVYTLIQNNFFGMESELMLAPRLLFVGCLTSQQQASVSQGQICSDNFTCCHTEIEVADQPFHLTQSQYTDTGPTSHSADPITPGAWQGNHWSANV